MNPRFLHYALCSRRESLDAAGQGSTFRELSADALASFQIAIPSHPSDQIAISDYLHHADGRIQTLIHAKERLAEVLTERLGRVVAQRTVAVETMPLKRAWRVIDCKHRTPTYLDDGWPLLSTGDIRPGVVDLTTASRFVDATDFADMTEGRRPRRGDIIYSRNASVGTAAYVAGDEPFCMGQDVCLLTSERADGRFLSYFLHHAAAPQIEANSIGSTFSRINVAQIEELRIPSLPSYQQRRIADALDLEARLTDVLLAKLDRQLAVLAEHRDALITAAVTGQIDVTREAPAPPEEALETA